VAWHPWTHTITNAAVVVAGVLWGQDDFALTICRAVQPLYDTDCSGATAGSIFGALHGKGRLPDAWLAPFRGVLNTAVRGYERVEVARLAADTLKCLET
jgi:ADP-ribosylglycohydrolase